MVEFARPIEMGPNDKWEVGLCEIWYPPNELGTFKPVLVVGDNTANVYCDLISPQFVGNSLVRCLRTYIHPSLHGEHNCDNTLYLPVEKHD